jgi:hypothetical protein
VESIDPPRVCAAQFALEQASRPYSADVIDELEPFAAGVLRAPRTEVEP